MRLLRKFPSSLIPRVAGFWDQGTMSLATLLQTALLARALDRETFGYFSIAMSISVVMQSLCRSAIFIPYLISQDDPDRGPSSEWVDAALRLLAWPLIIPIVLIALYFTTGITFNFAAVASGFVLAIGAIYYDINRRLALSVGLYVPVIVCASGILVTWLGLAIAAYYFSLNVFTVIGLNGFFCALCGAFLHRIQLHKEENVYKRNLYGLTRRNKANVAWNIAAFLPYAVYNNLAPTLIAIYYGPSIVAVYAATRVLLSPITMLGAAIDNIDKARASRALREHGIAGLQRSLLSYGATIVGLAMPYLCLGYIWCPSLLKLLIGVNLGVHVGEGRAWLLVAVFIVIGQPIETGLVLLKKSNVYFWSRCIGAGATIIGLILSDRNNTFAPIFSVMAGWGFSTVFAAIIIWSALRGKKYA